MKKVDEAKSKRVALNKKREIYHRELEQKQELNLKNIPEYKGDAFISLQHINKIYPNHVQAVYDFNLDINQKEFIVFVGPSGCGKSTTLRMIAGLEDITYGNLYMNKEFANTLLPKSRECAMVFQSYALYPNMTVYDNMGFSLKVRGEKKEVIHKKVLEAAKILELTDYLARKPGELSGGQRQRVALGRAIVRDAKIFLMDEPLSNLDAKLRVQMRSEIVALHKKIGSTTIYVTHDQVEAMTMADRIVVMKDGYVQQIGTPKEIYNNPSNVFVATFIGAPAMNILDVKYEKGEILLPNNLKISVSKDQKKKLQESIQKFISELEEKVSELIKENEKLSLPIEEVTDNLYKSKAFRKRIPGIINLNEEKIKEHKEEIERLKLELSSESFDVKLGVRPEDIVTEEASKIYKNISKTFELKIEQAELLGNEYYLYSSISDKQIIAKANANEDIKEQSTMKFVLNLDRIHLFDTKSSKSYF